MLLEHISQEEKENPKESTEFWSLLNYDRRCQMINQLPFDGLKRLFLAMELEDKSQLMGMVDEKRKDNLKK